MSESPGPARHTVQPRRILAPDLARGIALLGIAWANVSTAWVITDDSVPAAYFGGVVHGAADRVVVVLAAMFAHVRGLPMFTTLLGFGVGLVAAGLARRGYGAGRIRRSLLRRYGALLVFGLAHCLLLFFGDIMILYGVIGMVLALAFTLSDRALLGMAGALFALHLLGSARTLGDENVALSVPEFGGYAEYVSYNAAWATGYLLSAPIALTSMLPLAILGYVAARRGVHRDPMAHLRILTVWVLVAGAIILAVGLPWGLSAIGALPGAWEDVLMNLNQMLGYLTGPGICAGVLLASRRLQERLDRGASLPPALAPVQALGQRSMSGYVTQSLLFVPLTMPFLLGLGEGAGAAGLLLLALAVWAVTLLAAQLTARVGRPGPAESAHRRLAYGRRGPGK
ncbi:DUF418 domain-containing protein [Corynebacterium guangdongense]|uniref:Membrane protein YeiB n=1 Tax=Corynebacterium guangdongense TaxID=1783348 RepID=A0ABU2A022_9CORY|nr:DUF418 domain-containing protein [Corynebacterium guangdongense]MDR7329493.1 putative membrane protein YeiB [Corynebacterium guangdongense]WJZ18058.1 hypothetical protein CGUA_07480 [Corynebacterium guangdongense]